MKEWKRVYANLIFTVAVLAVCTVICMGMEAIFDAKAQVSAAFALAVFLVSVYTRGYAYGILAALLSVLAINFAFTFPYFKFNFTIPQNLTAALIMLVITILTSALTTKVKQQEKMKAESEKEIMRANLLRAVSHDLRTPLTTIYGSSSAIIEEYDSLTKEEQLQLAEGIREDAQWLIGMVENLLSVTRIDNEQIAIVKSPIVLEELIDHVLVRFHKRYPKQKVHLELPEEFISIPMDVVLISQVLGNLLENAVRHATGMTSLKLRVFIKGNQAVFEVTDDGCGIPKEKMQNILRGYYESKEVPADQKKRNMGIGLSVCATIIKAHAGKIEVEKRKPKGTCVRFYLNMEDEDHE